MRKTAFSTLFAGKRATSLSKKIIENPQIDLVVFHKIA
jgi:hypothetical protein